MDDAAEAITLEGLATDPHPLWHALRSTGPVTWVPAFDGWVISGRSEAIAAMRAAELFTVDDPRFTTSQVLGKNMLALDGVEHAQHREPFVAPYRRKVVVHEWTEWLRDAADALIDDFRSAGRAELRTAYAAPLAVETICRSLELVDADVDEILAWYTDLAQAIQDLSAGRATDGAADAYRALGETVKATIETSTTSVLTRASDAGLGIPDIIANAAVLMFGAIETSEGATANALRLLLRDQALTRKVRADPTTVANLVEETMRLEPSVAQLDRYATTNTRFGGADIGAGDFVMVSLAAANRDPAVFDQPDRFHPERHNARQHLTFAQGPHACIGIHLARLESQVAIEQLLARLEDLTLDENASTEPHGLVFRKPDRVVGAWSSSTPAASCPVRA